MKSEITRPEILEGIYRHIQPLKGLEQAELLEIAPGHARISFLITKEALNLYGNLHGGMIFSLCDITAGMATYAYEISNVTQNSSIQFLRGVSEGTIYIEANAIHKGRKTVVNQIQITNERDQLIATAAFTMFLIKEI